MKKVFYYDMPVGNLGIAESGGYITDVFFHSARFFDAVEEQSPIISEAAGQLYEYFEGKRKVFQLPLAPDGNSFSVKVWKALLAIPYGETRSYKDIALDIGNGNACRAVGGANNKNPIAIIIPCHRVIGKNGSLTGYAAGTDIKSFLLQLEKANK